MIEQIKPYGINNDMTKFIFIYIPKTAGLTFQNYYLARFHERKYFMDNTLSLSDGNRIDRINQIIESSLKYPRGKYERYNIIIGHFTIDKYRHLGRPQITFLRDPIERVISSYFYTLEQYPSLKSCRGQRYPHGFVDYIEANTDVMSKMLNYSLDELEFVGITEYFDESLKRFIKHFGFNHALGPAPVTNITRKKGTVDEETRRYIEQLNKADRELYDEALRRFNNGAN